MKHILTYVLFCALIAACKQKTTHKFAKSDWVDYKKAYTFKQLQQNDSAFYYFNKAATGNTTDSMQIAMAYNSMAIIQSDAGDHYGALESLVQSLKYLNDGNKEHHDLLARDFNEMALNSAELKNFNDALELYNKADKFKPDSNLAASIANNRAFCYLEKKDYRQALKLFRQIFKTTPNNGAGYARRLTNLATAEWLNNKEYKAAPLLLMALHLRKVENDTWGLNSSYAHLADYYMQTRPDSAFFYAKKMYKVASFLNSPYDQVEALMKLSKVAPPKQVKQYLELYQSLNDSLQIVRNANKNQFALIRYNVEKHKSESLQLQKDNAEKQYRLFKQQVIIYIIVAAVIVGGVFASYWYRKRKHELEVEKNNALRESELKMVKKVHDNVANGLYQLMSSIESTAHIHKNNLVDRLEELYHTSRNISHERVNEHASPEVAISECISSFANKSLKIAVVGNDTALWQGVKPKVIEELKLILLELMVNMRKHSNATAVVVTFSKSVGALFVSYKDNGIGMNNQNKPGKGLVNTGNRINDLNGKLNFEVQPEKGVLISITLPLT